MKKKKELIIGVLLVIFGVFVILLAMSLFSSDSSWGSVYSIIGVIISTVGVSILTKRFSLPKRIIIDISYFVLFILLLILIDYLGVVNINQAPRFAHFKANGEFFDTLFYDVIRCDIDTKYESYYVVDNRKYDGDRQIMKIIKQIEDNDVRHQNSVVQIKMSDYYPLYVSISDEMIIYQLKDN